MTSARADALDSPTKFPEGEKATDMTQEERKGMTCILLPVHVSQMMSLPSRDPVTACLRQHQPSVGERYPHARFHGG